MMQEGYAEHVVHLALIPIRRAPHACNGFNFRICTAEHALYTEPQILLEGMKKVENCKTRLGGVPVDTGDAAQSNEFLFVLKIPAQIHDFGGVGYQRHLGESFHRLEDRGMVHFTSSFR